MKSLTINSKEKNSKNQINNPIAPIVDQYRTYIASQNTQKVYWYLKTIILIPCVIMTTSIAAMAYQSDDFIWFIAFCMILFFANIITHIAGAKSSIFIPLYHLSIISMLLIPIITHLVQS